MRQCAWCRKWSRAELLTGGFMALMFGMAGTLLLTLGVMIVAGGMR